MAGYRLGSLSEIYESGERGSPTVGYDSSGGLSIGKYQIAHKPGGIKNYLDWVRNYYIDVYNSLNPYYSTIGSGSSSISSGFSKKWIEIARAGTLQDSEHEFIKFSHYDPAYSGLSSSVKSVVDQHITLQEILWSSSVQHGVSFSSSLFNSSYNSGASVEQYIHTLYDGRRQRALDRKNAGAFGNDVYQSLLNRYDKEEAQAISLYKSETPSGVPTAQISSTNVPRSDVSDRGAIEKLTRSIITRNANVSISDKSWTDLIAMDPTWLDKALPWGRAKTTSEVGDRAKFDKEIGGNLFFVVSAVLKNPPKIVGVDNPYSIDITKKCSMPGARGENSGFPLGDLVAVFWNKLMELFRKVEVSNGYKHGVHYYIWAGKSSAHSITGGHRQGLAVDIHKVLNGGPVGESGAVIAKPNDGDYWGLSPEYPIIKALGEAAPSVGLKWLGYSGNIQSGGTNGNDHEHFYWPNPSGQSQDFISKTVFKEQGITKDQNSLNPAIAQNVVDDLYNAIAGCVYVANNDATQQNINANNIAMQDILVPALLKNIADQEFLLRRFNNRVGMLNMPFSPWITPGFASKIEDNYGSSTKKDVYGMVEQVSHILDSGAATASTSVRLRTLRTLEEEFGDGGKLSDFYIHADQVKDMYIRLGLVPPSGISNKVYKRHSATDKEVIKFLQLPTITSKNVLQGNYAAPAKNEDGSSQVRMGNNEAQALATMEDRIKLGRAYQDASETTAHTIVNDDGRQIEKPSKVDTKTGASDKSFKNHIE